MEQKEQISVKIPQEFKCPISTLMMVDPVIAGDGIVYQRQNIQNWFNKSNRSPFTNFQLPHKILIPNISLRNSINNFKEKIPSTVNIQYIKIEANHAVEIKMQQMNEFNNKMQNNRKQFNENEEILRKKCQKLQNDLLRERRFRQQSEIKYNQEVKKVQMQKAAHLQTKIQLQKLKNQLQKINQMQVQKQRYLKAKQHLNTFINQNQYKDKTSIYVQCKDLSSINGIYLIRQIINTNIIQSLTLTDCKIDNQVIKQLSKHSFNNLTSLDLRANNIDGQGVKFLCESYEQFPQLQQLWLGGNKMGANNNPINHKTLFNFKNLIKIDLQKCNLNENQIKDLLNPHTNHNNYQPFKQIKVLWLNENNIGQQKTFVQFLAQHQYQSLYDLGLSNCKISKLGIQQLFNNKNSNIFPNIQQLWLDKNNLCSQSTKILASSKTKFQNLSQLSLDDNPQIGDQGIKNLTQGLNTFPNLLSLWIAGANLIQYKDKKQELIIKLKQNKKFPLLSSLYI